MKKMVMPEFFAAIEERYMSLDREYFYQNPNTEIYFRNYIPGEFFPADWNVSPSANIVDAMVRVSQIAPGVRTRMPLFSFSELAQRRSSERLAPDLETICKNHQALMEEHAAPAPSLIQWKKPR